MLSYAIMLNYARQLVVRRLVDAFGEAELLMLTRTGAVLLPCASLTPQASFFLGDPYPLAARFTSSYDLWLYFD